MATIVLVRHATTAATGKRLGGWTPGVHLDAAGVGQAERTAALLAELPVAAVYASPLERTQETAKLVARPHGLRVRTRRDLGEVDYGDWTDKPLGQLRRRKLWPVIQHTPSRVTFPGGESIRAMQARAVEAVESLAADHADETVVAVSHADVIKALLAHFLGMPLDAFQRLVVSPASASVLHLADGHAPVVAACNLTAGPLQGGRP
ncbi:MSMEG_4193 family putative phosphomutase [Egicoccus sp. AB-alg6-2]|uniref:MSMEG_4193 family putative phosphomutase n=1 Tax=Egicoccus sp. AB-alg6-2 TaxID=3242692 RepID=UPI00359D6AB7